MPCFPNLSSARDVNRTPATHIPTPSKLPRTKQERMAPLQFTPGELMSWGEECSALFTEHGSGVADRTVGDPKATTWASFHQAWTLASP